MHSKSNQFGDEGAKQIAEALAINNTLTTLHLGNSYLCTRNQIGDEGAKAIAEALKINSTLTDLHLTVRLAILLTMKLNYKN